MTTLTHDLSVAEAAKWIGVSRARVYQRITGYAGQGDAGQPLDVVVRTTHRPGTKMGRQFRVPIATALKWRAERQARGLPVGVIPDGVSLEAPAASVAAVAPPPPPTPDVSDAPVGMPTVSPF